MSWTAFPFSRGALAAALAWIPGVFFMTGCMENTSLTGSISGTGGTGAGGMGGTGATGATGGSSSMGGTGATGATGGSSSMGGGGTSASGGAGGMGGSGGGGISMEPWSKRFGDADSQSALATAVDGAGNVAITGTFKGTVDFGGGPLTSAGNDDIYVAKFDSSGNHVWSKRFGDADWQIPCGMAIDSAGNVAITGHFEGTVDFGGGPLTSAGNVDIYVAKFDANGNHVWSKRFGDADHQWAYATAVDSAGNVAITGELQGTVDFGGGPLTTVGSDIFVAKFDANGDHVWSKRFGDADYQEALGMAIDTAGNVAITGRLSGTVDFGGGPLTGGFSDIFVAKFDPSGNHLWSKRFGDANSQGGQAVAVDSAGNVAITGQLQGTVDFGGGPLTSAGDVDIYVAKFDSSGNHVWSKRFGDANSQLASAVAVDGAGNVAITGGLHGTVDFGGGPLTTVGVTDVFVARFDPSGNHVWSKRFGDTYSSLAEATAIDSAGNVVITGSFTGTIDFGNGPHASAGSSDVFLAKLAP